MDAATPHPVRGGAAGCPDVCAGGRLPANSVAAFDDDLYLVTMVGPGTAGYTGGFSTADYRTGLLRRQDEALALVGDPEPLQRWTTALSGFAVEIDAGDAARLNRLPGVRLVERDDVRRLAATQAAAPSLGVPSGVRTGGSGTVIGFVDSGLHVDGPVFADSPALGSLPNSFNGDCRDAAELCNRKVVTARHFVDAFGADRLRSGASLSPADDQGHGTMVAALAAGNRASPTGTARHVAKRFSGAAPDARVAVYKACWEAPDPEDDGCSSADVVSAIDAAVADGVDVLNLGMTGRAGLDTVDLATLGAAESDIVVVTPAGNDGGQIGHDAAWVTTVGAARTGDSAGAVELADGTRFEGTLSPRALADSVPVVDARQLALPGSPRARRPVPLAESRRSPRRRKRSSCRRRVQEVAWRSPTRSGLPAGPAWCCSTAAVSTSRSTCTRCRPSTSTAAGRHLRTAMAAGKLRARLVASADDDSSRRSSPGPPGARRGRSS
ncbi:S8 family serine peptidase [Nocardioides alcanivorans]|uniref:S8 family serine peptidase n=1 Tax=Nocardioides alcanivorans TaxID=2897352 RepID=UPI001F24FB16|nr:S8 family serine peptidase [Nocardioides alcanivorans]